MRVGVGVVVIGVDPREADLQCVGRRSSATFNLPRFIREDRMFTNSYRYVMSALLLYPLFAVVTLLTRPSPSRLNGL